MWVVCVGGCRDLSRHTDLEEAIREAKKYTTGEHEDPEGPGAGVFVELLVGTTPGGDRR